MSLGGLSGRPRLRARLPVRLGATLMDAPQRRRLRKELESLRHDSGCSTSKPTASSSSSSLLAEQFAQQGWVSLGSILTPAEVQHWQRVYDRDRSEDAAGRWVGGGVQSLNYDVLLSSPEFHQLVRHPTILAALQDLMAPGEQPALGEISLRHMQPSSAADPSAGVHQEWHRDHPHAERRRHRTGYFTLMLYLSDVDEHTPCFSISPEASDDKLLPAPQQLAARGFQDLQGPAGTAILFNLSVLHRASGHARTVARSTKERIACSCTTRTVTTRQATAAPPAAGRMRCAGGGWSAPLPRAAPTVAVTPRRWRRRQEEMALTVLLRATQRRAQRRRV